MYVSKDLPFYLCPTRVIALVGSIKMFLIFW